MLLYLFKPTLKHYREMKDETKLIVGNFTVKSFNSEIEILVSAENTIIDVKYSALILLK